MTLQDEYKRTLKNAREVRDCNWLIQVCDSALVEGDREFVTAFNRRVERFKSLFIEEENK